jgi:nicotinic acid mononucleotide adenylyltransferase
VAENVSATQVRAEIAAGRSVDHLTPPAIANYIAKYRLYR